ncbi:MAG TPA: cytochrome C oxidase subunit IV family protein [Chitinophagaceae bacterium]|nr:cytochrome C oxidase subunit IV family protein [Chitinophagaceae bacterium]
MEMQHAQVLEPQPTGMKDPVVRSLIRVFWILLCVTIIEVSFAFLHYFTDFPPRMLLNAIFIGLTVVKAFFIVAEFMHLKHELKNLVFSILVPLLFITWAITAFLSDGSSWNQMRKNTPEIEHTTPWRTVTHEHR